MNGKQATEMAARWYTIQILPQYERTAKFHLTRQNFQSYFPQVIVKKERRGEIYEAFQQLFTGYGFVSIDMDKDQWRCINGTRGVIGLLPKRSLMPEPMSIGFVEYFIDTGPIKPASVVEAVDIFYPGMSVRIKEGLLKDKFGTILAVRSNSTLEILLSSPYLQKAIMSKNHASPVIKTDSTYV